jgi:hypothetical protein
LEESPTQIQGFFINISFIMKFQNYIVKQFLGLPLPTGTTSTLKKKKKISYKNNLKHLSFQLGRHSLSIPVIKAPSGTLVGPSPYPPCPCACACVWIFSPFDIVFYAQHLWTWRQKPLLTGFIGNQKNLSVFSTKFNF